jgi:hypothetical protein
MIESAQRTYYHLPLPLVCRDTDSLRPRSLCPLGRPSLDMANRVVKSKRSNARRNRGTVATTVSKRRWIGPCSRSPSASTDYPSSSSSSGHPGPSDDSDDFYDSDASLSTPRLTRGCSAASTSGLQTPESACSQYPQVTPLDVYHGDVEVKRVPPLAPSNADAIPRFIATLAIVYPAGPPTEYVAQETPEERAAREVEELQHVSSARRAYTRWYRRAIGGKTLSP